LSTIVDEIVRQIVSRQAIDWNTHRLKSLASKAVPILLEYLDHPVERYRKVAFYGLQYCWNDEADQQLTTNLQSLDTEIRQNSAIVLAKWHGQDGLADLCIPLLTHENPEIARFAIVYVEAEQPDYTRILDLIQKKQVRFVLTRYLNRYYSPALIPFELEMIDQALEEHQYLMVFQLVIALIFQYQNQPEIWQKIESLCCHQNLQVKEAVCEFLLWYGNVKQLGWLDKVDHHVIDPYVKSMVSACRVMLKKRGDFQQGKQSNGLLFKKINHCETDADLMEPHLLYQGKPIEDDWIKNREEMLRQQNEQFNTDILSKQSDVTLLTPAHEFIPPVREYFDDERINYGKNTEANAKGFDGLVHVGDDCGWFLVHQPVVAIAAGRVVKVDCIKSWGHLIIVEHEMSRQNTIVLPSIQWGKTINSQQNSMFGTSGGIMFCSVYAHLSPLMTVKEGDLVEVGQRLGAIGRGHCWENGGYDPHLHFAIHLGPFYQFYRINSLIDIQYKQQRFNGKVVKSNKHETIAEIYNNNKIEKVHLSSQWLCGYLSKSLYKQYAHGWLNPQKFLKTQLFRTHALGNAQ
jgi:hypothetical protein